MKSKIYKFDEKTGLLDGKYFIVRDYFQYYTTGIESLIDQYPDNLALTSRENAERPEQIMYDIFGDADLADVFVALNNQNYLWSTPFELDAFHDAIEFRMNYVELLMRDRIQRIDVIGDTGEKILDEYGEPIWEYNDVGQACYDKVSEDIHAEDDKARQVVIPDKDSYQFIIRKINEYFKSREVK